MTIRFQKGKKKCRFPVFLLFVNFLCELPQTAHLDIEIKPEHFHLLCAGLCGLSFKISDHRKLKLGQVLNIYQSAPIVASCIVGDKFDGGSIFIPL